MDTQGNQNNLTTLIDNIFESICNEEDKVVLTKEEFEQTINRVVQWDRKRRNSYEL